jgi:hypothetical protein
MSNRHPADEAMNTYHLLRDLGIYKATVVRNFRDNDRGPEFDGVRELLARRTQQYTVDELLALSGFFWTAHDECVVDHCEEFSGVEVYTATRKIEAGEAAIARLRKLEEVGRAVA